MVSGNWDDLMEILSVAHDDVKKDNSFFWRQVLCRAVRSKRCDVIEFLIRKGWHHVPLDELLNYAADLGESLETVSQLCLLGAGDITDYWGACNRLNGRRVSPNTLFIEEEDLGENDKQLAAVYGILLEHNVVVSPRMFFCEEGDLDESEIRQQQQQQPLTFLLDIPGDCCRKRRKSSIFTVEDEDVLGIARLCLRNGVPIVVKATLQKQLPKAQSRVSAIMAAALQPASLQALCRKVIRLVSPKRKFKSRVPELGLPERLSVFLCSSSSSKAKSAPEEGHPGPAGP